jgi:hypothetical protein
MKPSLLLLAIASIEAASALRNDIDSFLIEMQGMRKRLGRRGRWVIVYTIEDGSVRGVRCRRKSKARAIARELKGKVRRWRSRDWGFAVEDYS